MFGNLYLEIRGIKISFLYTNSIMKDIIIISILREQQQNATGTFMIVKKKNFKRAGENSNIILTDKECQFV